MTAMPRALLLLVATCRLAGFGVGAVASTAVLSPSRASTAGHHAGCGIVIRSSEMPSCGCRHGGGSGAIWNNGWGAVSAARAAAGRMRGGAAAGSDQYKARMQVMITRNMRKVLIDELDYLPDEVDDMDPQIAAVVIEKSLPRPRAGMPIAWRRSIRQTGGRPPNPLRYLTGAIQAALEGVVNVAVAVVAFPFVAAGTGINAVKRVSSIGGGGAAAAAVAALCLGLAAVLVTSRSAEGMADDDLSPGAAGLRTLGENLFAARAALLSRGRGRGAGDGGTGSSKPPREGESRRDGGGGNDGGDAKRVEAPAKKSEGRWFGTVTEGRLSRNGGKLSRDEVGGGGGRRHKDTVGGNSSEVSSAPAGRDEGSDNYRGNTDGNDDGEDDTWREPSGTEKQAETGGGVGGGGGSGWGEWEGGVGGFSLKRNNFSRNLPELNREQLGRSPPPQQQQQKQQPRQSVGSGDRGVRSGGAGGLSSETRDSPLRQNSASPLRQDSESSYRRAGSRGAQKEEDSARWLEEPGSASSRGVEVPGGGGTRNGRSTAAEREAGGGAGGSPKSEFQKRRRMREGDEVCPDAPVSPNAGGAVWFEDLPPAPPAPDTIGVLDEEEEAAAADLDRRPRWGRKPMSEHIPSEEEMEAWESKIEASDTWLDRGINRAVGLLFGGGGDGKGDGAK